MHRARPFIIMTVLLICSLTTLNAQDNNGGQFCVRAFEDTNANGTRDPGEALIQSGFSANLQNASGVVIDSATIKLEAIPDGIFVSRQQARIALFDYIKVFYNRQRLHSAIGYATPVSRAA